MEQQPTSESTENSLEIETASGLERFLEYVEEAKAAVEHDISDDEELAQAKQKGESAYHDLKALIARCQETLASGGEVADEDVEAMQFLYNEMIAAGDAFEATSVVSEAEEEIKLEVENPEDGEGNDGIEEEGETVAPDRTEETLNKKNVAANDTEVTEPITAEEVEALETRVEGIVENVRELLDTYKKPVSDYPDSSLNAAGILYEELTTSAARAETLLHDVKKINTTSVIRFSFERFEDVADEIEENITVLEKALDDLLSMRVSIDTVSTKTSPESSIAKPATGALTVAPDVHESSTIAIKTIKPVAPAPMPPREASSPSRSIHNELRVIEGGKLPSNREVLKSEISPYIEAALKDARYKTFIDHAFSGSTVSLETELQRRIEKEESFDAFHRMLGLDAEYKNAFYTLLKDMTLEELERFNAQDTTLDRPRLRKVLDDKKIKYEMYVKWMERFDVAVSQNIMMYPRMKFGELFVRSELEQLMADYQ